MEFQQLRMKSKVPQSLIAELDLGLQRERLH
jgi:hypothetical protein